MKRILLLVITANLAALAASAQTQARNQSQQFRIQPLTEDDANQILVELFPDRTSEYVYEHTEVRLATKKECKKHFTAISLDGYHSMSWQLKPMDSVWTCEGKIYYSPTFRSGAFLLKNKSAVNGGTIARVLMRAAAYTAQYSQQYYYPQYPQSAGYYQPRSAFGYRN